MERLTVLVREARQPDFEGIWPIFHGLIASGDTLAFPADTSREQALAYWLEGGTSACYVAVHQGRIMGAYRLGPNQPGLGSHVANATYIVDPASSGHGVGQMLGLHSLQVARARGYRAMQFNLVVSTNERAVRLWTRLGFAIIATLPGAFRHASLGYVDAYVMHRSLLDIAPRGSVPNAGTVA